MKPTPTRKRTLVALGAILLYCASHTATAIPLDTVSFYGYMSFNHYPPNPVEVIGPGHVDLLPGPGGLLRIESGLNPSPFVLASVLDVRDGYYARVIGNMDYWFEVVNSDPLADQFVTVYADARGEVHGGVLDFPGVLSALTMTARWSIENANTGARIFGEGIQTPVQQGRVDESFANVTTLILRKNQKYKVNLFADVAIANGYTNGAVGGAYAYIDPVFSFASDVGAGYSFLFSEGVGNTREVEAPPVGVAEPDNLALMSAVLIPLGLYRRRKRLIGPVAAAAEAAASLTTRHPRFDFSDRARV